MHSGRLDHAARFRCITLAKFVLTPCGPALKGEADMDPVHSYSHSLQERVQTDISMFLRSQSLESKGCEQLSRVFASSGVFCSVKPSLIWTCNLACADSVYISTSQDSRALE